jgi:hypothetical protein
MWTCPKCSQRVDDHFEICWKCGTSVDGDEDPHFLEDSPAGPAPEQLPDAAPPIAPEHLVTIASCSLPAEALAMRLKLEDAGIPVFLADEYTVVMDWLLSNAIGGIKVQVADHEALRARQILGLDIPEEEEMAEEEEPEESDESEPETNITERPEDY